MDSKNIPLCVDLDGTFIRTDMMMESIALLILKRSFFLFIIPFWLLKGRYYLKSKLLEYVLPNIKLVPINPKIEEFVISERKKGRYIILVTASMQEIANQFKNYYNIFDEAIGSKDDINLVGKTKADYLINRFGRRGFDYIGDSDKDFYVWKSANIAHIVNQNERFINRLREITNIGIVWDLLPKSKFQNFISEIRTYQWTKNLLIFLPLILAHNTNANVYINALLAFFSFSFAASAIYLFNDLMDLDSDREHSTKKNRPMAAGNFPIISAFRWILILIITSLLIALLLHKEFLIVLIMYLVITLVYSIKLKKIYIIDIVVLSILYTFRLIAGSFSTNIPISEWLAGFSLFFFLSMSALKRYVEIKNNLDSDQKAIKGRAYITDDLQIIQNSGISSGLISVMIFFLYINSSKVVQLYNSPEILYLIIPLIVYWILRVWFLAHRGLMNEDPVLFAIADKRSYLFIISILLILMFSTL